MTNEHTAGALVPPEAIPPGRRKAHGLDEPPGLHRASQLVIDCWAALQDKETVEPVDMSLMYTAILDLDKALTRTRNNIYNSRKRRKAKKRDG